jgi:hypothetical protein
MNFIDANQSDFVQELGEFKPIATHHIMSIKIQLNKYARQGASHHLRVILSHFSGVVMIRLASLASARPAFSLSPVNSTHFTPSEANRVLQSRNRSAHNDLVGAI